MLPDLLRYVPATINGYVEPMVGGGALYFALAQAGRLEGLPVTLNDICAPLMMAYRGVAENVEAVIAELAQLCDIYARAPRETFYRLRAEANAGKMTPARFILLKQTAFNGLWRYNASGNLNTSWGQRPLAGVCSADHLRDCSAALAKANLMWGKWQAALERAEPGSLVFLDPPYADTFNAYAQLEAFTAEMHEELLDRCAEACGRGVFVLYTHADTPAVRHQVRRIWPEARIRSCLVRRAVNRDGANRENFRDLVVASPE